LLSPAEVSAFLGKVTTCAPVHSNTSGQDIVAAGWQTPRGDQTVKAGVSRKNIAEDKETFEDDAGTKSNGSAKVVGGLGDDAVLIADPHSATSGSILILHGNDVIVVTVTRGKLTGDALVKALKVTGRRLLATY
jgi:hypothetical protein